MPKKKLVFPWDENYTAESNPVPPEVHLPWLNPATPVSPVSTSPATPASFPPVNKPLSPVTPVVVPGENWVAEIEKAAVNAAEQAYTTAGPQLRQTMADYIQSYVTALLSGQKPPLVPNISVTTATGKELTVASAKSRSFRTFFIGMGISIVFALANIVGSLAGLDFSSRTGWVILGSLVIQTIIASALSYLARIKIAPPYAEPPSG